MSNAKRRRNVLTPFIMTSLKKGVEEKDKEVNETKLDRVEGDEL